MPDESTIPVTACVLHTGCLDRGGYGHVNVRMGERVALAHRAAWEAARGPVPAGLQLHHVCKNRACVNVDHLMAVTPKQHMALHPRTHCVNGHPFDAENTYARPDRPGQRECRACHRVAGARHYRKAKAA